MYGFTLSSTLAIAMNYFYFQFFSDCTCFNHVLLGFVKDLVSYSTCVIILVIVSIIPNESFIEVSKS